MHLHEYQTKEILKNAGISVPQFAVATTPDEAVDAAKKMGTDQVVLKVQIHAGGRGKAGGVVIAKGEDEIRQAAEKLIGMKVVNEQTGPEGLVSSCVLVSELSSIAKEYYLSALIDRPRKQAIIMASSEGGVEIEETAKTHPEKIVTFPIQLDGSLRSYHLIELAKVMGWEWKGKSPGLDLVKKLAKAFLETDASMLEINPLVLTDDGDVVALDAKMSVDDNAMFRHKDLEEYYDPSQIPKHEAKAHEYDLAYVAMDGNIGCMVNGAGLAMATMDIIQHHGATPANFLDVGGGASKEKVAEGFRLILSDEKVQAILVNIFGGIMDCGVLAEGILAAVETEGVPVPLVVRMEGTNVERGRKLLAESNLNIIVADGLSQAAEKVVQAATSQV